MTLSRDEGGVGGGGLEGNVFPALPLKMIFLCTICDVTFHAMTLPDKLSETLHLKGEVSRKFDVISKPKNVCLTTETKKKV